MRSSRSGRTCSATSSHDPCHRSRSSGTHSTRSSPGSAEHSTTPALRRAESGATSDPDWIAPRAITSWRRGIPLETIRYAGANRLKVEIDYRAEQGRSGPRVVEPYSLRRTQDGNLVLFVVNDHGQRAATASTASPASARPTCRSAPGSSSSSELVDAVAACTHRRAAYACYLAVCATRIRCPWARLRRQELVERLRLEVARNGAGASGQHETGLAADAGTKTPACAPPGCRLHAAPVRSAPSHGRRRPSCR